MISGQFMSGAGVAPSSPSERETMASVVTLAGTHNERLHEAVIRLDHLADALEGPRAAAVPEAGQKQIANPVIAQISAHNNVRGQLLAELEQAINRIERALSG